MTKKDFRIIFMGTPDFAVESLKSLYKNHFNIVAVITAPDKPAGRGKKIQTSAVKKYAEENNLLILQPVNLKNEQFIKELQELKADLQIVVAFRMLPEVVWAMPEFGTINIHASLLPDYRGAAPINHAIINGETKTGVTSFFIEREIDTGKIIFQKEVKILPNENAGQLHDKLMTAGGKLIVKTVNAIINKTVNPVSQKTVNISEIKPANKIFKQDCEINFNQNTVDVYNFIRGLSPYPAAWTKLTDKNGKNITLKIFATEMIIENHSNKAGKIISDNKTYIKIATPNGYINIADLQLQGKKRMPVKDLLNGFDISEYILN
ncbi:MAG: methionyl-tRNA formyltransferase [Bacteroidales bacterium]|nr:methionyl-tRNA formyltransferase [Bacteroidales bacterium]